MLPQADGPESDEDERGVDAEEHDHTDPESDFFCDATGQTLRLGTHELCTPKQVFLSCRLRAVLVQARGGIAWVSRTTCARRSTASCRRALRAPASSLSNASVTCTPRPVLPFPLRPSKAKDDHELCRRGADRHRYGTGPRVAALADSKPTSAEEGVPPEKVPTPLSHLSCHSNSILRMGNVVGPGGRAVAAGCGQAACQPAAAPGHREDGRGNLPTTDATIHTTDNSS